METFRGDKVIERFGKKSIFKNGEFLEIDHRYLHEIKKGGKEKKEKKERGKDAWKMILGKRFWKIQMQELTTTERVIWIELEMYACHELTCYVSIRTMANDLKLSKTTILKAIKGLENKQWIKKTKRKHDKWLNNTYTLNMKLRKKGVSVIGT